MKETVQVISSAEAAYLLHDRLGPLRAWSDFLSDNIRGLQHVYGFTLLPCCRRLSGKGLRPAYSVADVEKFIANVLAVNKSAALYPLMPLEIVVDRSRDWRVNVITPSRHGSSMCVHTPSEAANV